MLTPDRLNERKKAAKKFKDVFGWDVDVKLSECFRQENEVIDSNVLEEIRESEELKQPDSTQTESGDTEGQQDQDSTETGESDD